MGSKRNTFEELMKRGRFFLSRTPEQEKKMACHNYISTKLTPHKRQHNNNKNLALMFKVTIVFTVY